jgi:thymidylate synthase
MIASMQYRMLLRVLDSTRAVCSPRGMSVREIRCHVSEIDMMSPIVTNPARGLDYEFMVSEALWILSGKATLDDESLKKNLLKYSDDGISMSGAYGPMFMEQQRYVVEKLREDPETRQAVMTFWRPNPRSSKDVPCTVSMQFLIRGGLLHTNVFMRSSDAWLGWPYDVFTFTMITAFIGCQLIKSIELGQLTLIAGSQHLYQRHWDKVQSVLDCVDNRIVKDISLFDIKHPEYLINCLDHIRHCLRDNPAYIFDIGEVFRSL